MPKNFLWTPPYGQHRAPNQNAPYQLPNQLVPNQVPNYNAQYQAPNQLVQYQMPNQYAPHQGFNQYLAYLQPNVNVQHQAPNQLVQHQMPNANVPYQAPNPPAKDHGYKTFYCYEPNCAESRRSLSTFQNHMRNAHGKEMDPSLIKCVISKAMVITPYMCTHCQMSCRYPSHLKQHFKSPKHVKNLMLLHKVPLDTWDLVSKNQQVLELTDLTDSDTALKSLLELVDLLRDQKPTPDCVIIKSEPR